MSTLDSALKASAVKPAKVTHPSTAAFRKLARMFGTAEVHIAIGADGAVYVTDMYAASMLREGSADAAAIVSALSGDGVRYVAGGVAAVVKVRRTGDAFTVLRYGSLTAETISKLFACPSDATVVTEWTADVGPDDVPMLRGKRVDSLDVCVDADKLRKLVGKRVDLTVLKADGYGPCYFVDGDGTVVSVLMPIRVK